MTSNEASSNGHGDLRGPLTGIRILDVSILQNGPFSTVMLSDMGADVIKIEHAQDGDPARNARLVPAFDSSVFNLYFETMNRNKRSVTLDLKNPKGYDVFKTLVKGADVVVQNFRVGVAQCLGIDYESLKAINPSIIRAANSGLGHRGTEATQPLLDGIGQARTGFTHVMSDPDGTSSNIGSIGFADPTGAIVMAYAITLALLARERYGIGQSIETSQLGAMMILMQSGIHQAFIGNHQPRRIPRGQTKNPLSNAYLCSDDKWITLAAVQSDRWFASVAKTLDREGLLEDPRFSTLELRQEHQQELISICDEAFAEHPREHWLEKLREVGMIMGPVQTFADLETDPQCIANDYIVELEHPTLGKLKEVGTPIYFSETPGRPRSTAPEFGQHTEEMLLEHGYMWEQIEGLRTAGAI